MFKNSHFKLWTLLLGLIISVYANTGLTKTVILDTPTALSLDKGEYQVDAFFYNYGGMLTKVGVGINQYINLGILEYSDGLVGYGENKWSIPGVSAKIRFTDKEADSYNVAIGFDSFYHNSFSSSKSSKIYGVYAVFSKGFYLGESFADPSLFSVGVRYPLIYELGQPNVFASLYFNLFAVFDLATEIENLHFSKQYEYNFIFNNSLIFQLAEELSLNFVFQLAMEHTEENQKSKLIFARGLRITFNNSF